MSRSLPPSVCDRGIPRPAATGRLHSPVRARGAAAALALLAAGCGLQEDDGLEIGNSELASKVGDHVASACSTEVVLGLSRQISNEVSCLSPDSFVRFEEGNGIVFAGSAVLPYLTPPGKRDLEAAVAAAGGTLSINSAFRTVAQQYLLVQWHNQGPLQHHRRRPGRHLQPRDRPRARRRQLGRVGGRARQSRLGPHGPRRRGPLRPRLVARPARL